MGTSHVIIYEKMFGNYSGSTSCCILVRLHGRLRRKHCAKAPLSGGTGLQSG